MNKYLGVVLVLVAIAIAVVPHYTDCLAHGATVTLANGSTQPMKCHWSAQAEIAAAVPLAGVGIMIAASRRKSLMLGASILGVLLGAMAIAIPDTLIGTCGSATHVCNTTMKPSIIGLSSVAIVGSLVGMIISWKGKTI
jgi:hypothetical protein